MIHLYIPILTNVLHSTTADVKMVADALIYHPAVTHYNKFVATTRMRYTLQVSSSTQLTVLVGRDKTLRTIQYFSRFLAWYTYRTNHPQSTVALYDGIKKNLGSVRKAMRLGKFIEHFKAAAVASDSKGGDQVLKYLTVGRQLGYAFYMLLDNATYVDHVGIKKFEAAARLQKEAYRAWFVGLACNITMGVYSLYNMQTQVKKVTDTGDAEKAVEMKKLVKYARRSAESGVNGLTRAFREKTATQLQLLSDVCDITVPSTALGYANFDDGIVGLAGTLSSIIGLTAAWAKTA